MNGSAKPFSLPSYVVRHHNTVKERLQQQDQTENMWVYICAGVASKL